MGTVELRSTLIDIVEQMALLIKRLDTGPSDADQFTFGGASVESPAVPASKKTEQRPRFEYLPGPKISRAERDARGRIDPAIVNDFKRYLSYCVKTPDSKVQPYKTKRLLCLDGNREYGAKDIGTSPHTRIYFMWQAPLLDADGKKIGCTEVYEQLGLKPWGRDDCLVLVSNPLESKYYSKTNPLQSDPFQIMRDNFEGEIHDATAAGTKIINYTPCGATRPVTIDLAKHVPSFEIVRPYKQ